MSSCAACERSRRNVAVLREKGVTGWRFCRLDHDEAACPSDVAIERMSSGAGPPGAAAIQVRPESGRAAQRTGRSSDEARHGTLVRRGPTAADPSIVAWQAPRPGSNRSCTHARQPARRAKDAQRRDENDRRRRSTSVADADPIWRIRIRGPLRLRHHHVERLHELAHGRIAIRRRERHRLLNHSLDRRRNPRSIALISLGACLNRSAIVHSCVGP